MQLTHFSLAILFSSVTISLAEPILTSQIPLGTASGGALDKSHAHSAPTPIIDEAIALVTTGPLTINVHNSAKIPVTVTYGSNSGVPPPLSHPTPGPLAPGADLQFVAPEGWAGRIIVGNNFDSANSKIEASLDGQPNIDVSYVDGFSAPIVCSCDGRGVVTGCNLPLFKMNKCPNEGPGMFNVLKYTFHSDIVADNGPATGPVCYNPEQNVPYGPASPFFAACAGAAYTYPKDDGADTGCASHTINCCVGPQCPPNPKQH